MYSIYERERERDVYNRDHVSCIGMLIVTFLFFQFSLLADRLAQEQQEIQVRKKAQEKVNSILP